VLFIDPELWSIVWLTVRVGGTALLVSAGLGIPLGAVVGLSRFPGRRVVTALIFTGMGLPPVVAGLAIYLLLSRSGPLAFLGWLFTPAAMVLAQTVIAVPVVAGITLAAVSAVPAELLLQVRSLGATGRQVSRAALREARPGVLVAVAAAFGRIISEVGAALIVGGNIQDQTRVLTTAIVLETGKGEFALALSLGGWLVTLAFFANLLVVRLQRRPEP
jgi:tungstate transport system permease protein